MRTPHSVRERGHGALIIVVLLGLAIVLVMMFAGGEKSYVQQVSNTRKQGKELAANLTTDQITLMIAQYREENKKLPATWEDLEGVPRQMYTDPWGNLLTFKFETSPAGKTTVTYVSAGADGQAGNADDVKRTDTLPF